MSQSAATPLNDDTWQVPKFTQSTFGQRCHDVALVIPVINEGDRVRNQLKRIQTVAASVDVVIADGGSTDGSLDSEFLAATGVRALLTKTGPGKLSAQLRMAYSWCLQEGYEGIVTIDGNGKDGVSAVDGMVDKLRDGFDYVQGSRYLPGGNAQNTPLERTIANRLLHAPLLSLAGKHRYTDTTNGFRAYSSRYLLDSRVQPFRDVFQNYELLFYLTVRAGQIGMQVGHLPVDRRYVSNAKIPTKIDSRAKQLAVLRQTFSAAFGRFSPN